MRTTLPHPIVRTGALFACLLVSWPAFAQGKPSDEPGLSGDLKPPTPSEDEGAKGTKTSSSAVERPQEGPGSLIPPEESQPLKPPTAAEVEAAEASPSALIAAMTRELEYYQQGAASFAADMREGIRLRYADQKEQIASQYDHAVEEVEARERERRLEAIARFEEFLRKYPSDSTYTPDAMFRLAELYFEKASDEYLVSSKNYEKQLAAFERGELASEPQQAEPHYEKTIGLYIDLLGRFPEYRLADAARYLLGYCYGEQQQPEEALAVFNDLVVKHPRSKFLAEVWTRIGEIYFERNDPASLAKAIQAYSMVSQFKDSPYYDKALYKIAWTYYRLDRFSDAVGAFIGLVQYADEQKRTTGKSGSELRAEALQYIAISLADEEWGGLDRARSVLEPYQKKPFVADIWKRYGEILFDQTRFDLAIQIFQYTLDYYPGSPQNPEVQAKIVKSFELLRDFDGATAAREKLVKNYSEGSQWYALNRDDKPAITTAKTLIEQSLYSAAIFRHQQAQAHKAANRLAEAKRSYEAAASAYQQYLSQFPDAKNAYDFEFFLAECLYYSEDYVRSAEQYDRVRDSTIDNSHLDAAALSSVITYEKEIERLQQTGKLPALTVVLSADRKGKPPVPTPLPPMWLKLVESSDRYVKLLPNSERMPAIAYRAAEAFYKHDQFEEARRRFEAIIAQSPGSEVARGSANLIIESYLTGEDWENVEASARRLKALTVAAKEPPKSPEDSKSRGQFVDNLQKFIVGAQFKRAEKFDAEGNFEEAAKTYVTLVNENPQHEFADKALFNAAVSFEKVKLFETASQVYQRIYDQYPKSDLAPRALFRVGVNYEKGYDFPGAIAAYTKLVEKYPSSENRADALYNVAVTLENMQQYGQAAQAFKRYAQTFEKREDAGENFYRAALVYEKMKSWPDMIDTLRAFIGKYKNAPQQRERIVEAYLKMGDAYRAQNDEKNALANYQSCVKEFAGRHLSPESRASGDAAKCQFEIAEADFRRYDALKIAGRGNAQVLALKNKAESQRRVEKAYSEVFRYKRVETTLAASYRIGHSYERFAESLFSAEVPPEFKGNEELEAEYRTQLEEKAEVLERKAEQAYRKAFDEAKRTRVTNEWTERTLEGLNKYQPQEFPVQRSGKPLMQTFTISGNPLDGQSGEKPAPKTPGTGQRDVTDRQRTAEAKNNE